MLSLWMLCDAWLFRLALIRKTIVIFSCPVSSQPGMWPPTLHPLVTLLHHLETQNWGSEVPSAEASSASCRMMWCPWCAITSQQPFAKETVYHRHSHEASWNLSPGGCICPAAFPGSTPPETIRWDLIFWKKYACVTEEDLTQKLVDTVATWLN